MRKTCHWQLVCILWHEIDRAHSVRSFLRLWERLQNEANEATINYVAYICSDYLRICILNDLLNNKLGLEIRIRKRGIL